MNHIDKLIKATKHKGPDYYLLKLSLSTSVPIKEASTRDEEIRNQRDFAKAHIALRHKITGPIIKEIRKTREAILNECDNPTPRLSIIKEAFMDLINKIEPST